MLRKPKVRMRIAGLAAFLLVGASSIPQLAGQATQAAPDQTAPASVSQSASAPQPAATSSDRPNDDSFVIGNDDVLGISVWNEADMKQSIPVRPDGKISLPLIGEVQAAGRTPLQLSQDIAAKLTAFITQPQVTVIVQQINSQKFNILGRVAKPGAYSLTVTTTVLDAIADAGGFIDFAKQSKVYILRKNPAGGQSRIDFNYKDVIKGKHSEQNVKIEPHDTIVVP